MLDSIVAAGICRFKILAAVGFVPRAVGERGIGVSCDLAPMFARWTSRVLSPSFIPLRPWQARSGVSTDK